MLIELIDTDGRERTIQVDAPYAEAAARVINDDYGGREVRIGGLPPGGPAKDYYRKLWESWERGEHLEGCGVQ